LAVVTSFPDLFHRLSWGDGSSDTWALMRRRPEERWSSFVEDLGKENEEWNHLVAALQAVQPTVTLPDNLEAYQLWAPRVSRFSFAGR
jgi:hypothetical protein